jgi:hypothetical protein
MPSSSYWFPPEPADLGRTRLILDLGLRATDQALSELVVPGIGRVSFVRQLSWSAAAIALSDELRVSEARTIRPTVISHGLEALGCKLAFKEDASSARILGKRAFGRDQELALWTFSDLKQRRHYVRNTHRQATARALVGLKLAAGVRFDRFELKDQGPALAAAFLDQQVGTGGTKLRKRLIAWLIGEAEIDPEHESLRSALSPDHPSAAEAKIIQSRLLEVGPSAKNTRLHLSRALGDRESSPDPKGIRYSIVPRLEKNGRTQQAQDILTALAFGDMMASARKVLGGITALVADRGSATVKELTIDPQISAQLSDLSRNVKQFHQQAEVAKFADRSSQSFLREIEGEEDPKTIIRNLVRRAKDLLAIDGDLIRKGPLFRPLQDRSSVRDEESPPDDAGDSTFRIANLHALLRDCADALKAKTS